MNVTTAVVRSNVDGVQRLNVNEGKTERGNFLMAMREAVKTPANKDNLKLLTDLLQQIQQILQKLQKNSSGDLLLTENKSDHSTSLVKELSSIIKELEDQLNAQLLNPAPELIKSGGSQGLKTSMPMLKQQAEILLQLLNKEFMTKPSNVMPQEMEQKLKSLIGVIESLVSNNKSAKDSLKQPMSMYKSGTVQTDSQEPAKFSLINKSVENGKSHEQLRQMVTSNRLMPQVDGRSGYQPAAHALDSGPMSRLQQFVMHIERPGTSQAKQQFVREFAQIISKGRLSFNGTGQQQLTIKLYPEHLGTIDVKLVNNKGQLTATILTQTSMVKDLVDTHLHQLRSAFTGQNLQVDKLEVMHSQHNQAFEKGSDESESESEERRENNGEQRNQDDEEQSSSSFLEWLENHLT